MSISELLRQLETCAQIIMAPPDNISVNDRLKAEEIFLNFQKTKTPFELCREILETSQNQFVLFQTGACLKNAIIREWSLLELEQSRALFNYLFEYVNRRHLDQYVIEELMLVNAVIVKRISIDRNDIAKLMIVSLYEIIKNPASIITMRLNACTSIIQIMNEYCTLNYNSDYGLSWYAHSMAKKMFEKHRLKDIFKGVVEVLYEHVKLPEETRRTKEWIKLSTYLIRICEIILSWNFDVLHLQSIYYAKYRGRIESQVFNPPKDWMEFIVEGNLVSFFFELYLTFRSIDPNLLHSGLNCLTQLSTMAPAQHILSLRVKFSEAFMANTNSLCNMIMEVISIHEVVFLANLFYSICIYLRSHSIIQHCDFALTKQFVEVMIKLTCKVLLQSIKIKIQFDEDDYNKCNQSIEYLISSVTIIVNLVQYIRQMYQELPVVNMNLNEFITIEQLVVWTKPLFETYLRVHLSEPEGLLPLSCFHDEDEIQEFEENDNTLYREQIIGIGSIAQIDLLNSINTITQLLILKLQQFEVCIRSEGKSDEKMLQWVRISEDIHWILMISTFIFTSHAENEIPIEVVKVSIQANADIQSTQAALQTGDFTRSDIDPVVRYFIVLFKLVQMEKQLLENNMAQWVSPQVSYTLTYFVSRFMNVYLVPPEFENDVFSEMSLSLNTCFGADSPNAKNLVNYFLDHLETKFLAMSSETKVLELSSDGLRTFCKFRERIKLLQECASLHRLLQRIPFDQNFRKLNNVVHRHMYCVFIAVFSNNQDLIIDPLIQLHQTLNENLRSSHIESIQEEFLLLVDFIIGISTGLTLTTFNNVWRKLLLPFYNNLPKFLKAMHKCSIVVQAILELLSHFSLWFCGFFQEEDNVAFYDTAVAILNEYAVHTKDTYSIDSSRLEEIQAELIWILKFLNDLSGQDIFFFFTNTSITTSLSQTIGNVVLTSLNIIMPLMNDQLLENERLCSLYYKVLEFISQDTERFKGFPIKLFESYLKSVEYAFKASNISNEVKTIGFKILMEIALQTAQSSEPSEEVLRFLKPFFHVIIEFIFGEVMRNNDLILRDSVAMALHSLVRCFKDTYHDNIRQVMRCINDQQIEERICNSLFEIIDESGPNCLKFKDLFPGFINKLNMMLSLR